MNTEIDTIQCVHIITHISTHFHSFSHHTESTLGRMTERASEPYILINAGTQTRRAFAAGLGGGTHVSYHSKRMLIHIDAVGALHFLYRNAPISLETPYLFLRLRSNDQHFCGLIEEYCAHHHIPTNDPINLSYSQSAEKITQMVLLALQGVRIPESFIFREESFRANYDYLKEHLTFPLVYKLDGSQGRDVHLVESFEALEAHVAAKPPHRLALVQPFIENTFDTRTLVFEDEILGSISRTRTHGFLNNIAQGATAAPYTLTDAERVVALRAAKTCRIDFAGVDMIHTTEGPIVLEVNKSPQIGGFESVHNVKVFSAIATHIKREHPQK